jgi:N-acetylglucosaminyldiphosphoundecaprenol N-acetyl-beta-D-mannosaminyltransferase
MHTGNIRQGPRFIQRCGFEWLFRLCIEPRRLWRRYLMNNVGFLSLIIGRRPTRVR